MNGHKSNQWPFTDSVGRVLAVVGLILSTMAAVATSPPASANQLHQVVIVDGLYLVQRSRTAIAECGGADCWSDWYDRKLGGLISGTPQLDRGEVMTGVSFFTTPDGVLHEYVIVTKDGNSELRYRVGHDDWTWQRADLPGHGPVTSFATTTNGDGTVNQYYWRGIGREHHEQKSYQRLNVAELNGLLPGEDGGDWGFTENVPANPGDKSLREIVFDDMSGDLDVDDEWLKGPTSANVVWPDESAGSLIQAVWIDSTKGNHGFFRNIPLAENGNPNFNACADSLTCNWNGPVTDWELGLGDAGGQTFYVGPSINQEPLNSHYVRIEHRGGDSDGLLICSGTLVGKDRVLTAGSCLHEYNSSGDLIREIPPGELQVRGHGDTGPDYPWVSNIYGYGFPDRGEQTFDPAEPNNGHDLAILLLEDTVSKRIRPARLSIRSPGNNTQMKATGWDESSNADANPALHLGRVIPCEYPDTIRGGRMCINMAEDQISVGNTGMGWRGIDGRVFAVQSSTANLNGVEPQHQRVTRLDEYGPWLTSVVPVHVIPNVFDRQRVMIESSQPIMSGTPSDCWEALFEGPEDHPVGVPEIAKIVYTVELQYASDGGATAIGAQVGNLTPFSWRVPEIIAGGIVVGQSIDGPFGETGKTLRDDEQFVLSGDNGVIEVQIHNKPEDPNAGISSCTFRFKFVYDMLDY